jgi:hypothetical protein
MTDENNTDFLGIWGDIEEEEDVVPAPEPAPEVPIEPEEEVVQATTPDEEVDEVAVLKQKIAELEKAQAQKENVTLPAPPQVKIEPPKSILEEWKNKFGVKEDTEFGDALVLLQEIDELRKANYERDLQLAEVNSLPAVRKAQFEKQAIEEINVKGKDWEAEFMEIYDRSAEIAKLSDTKKAKLIEYLGDKIPSLIADRKLQGKPISNPLLLMQKDINAKLDELVAKKAPAQQIPQTPAQTQVDKNKKLMSLNSGANESLSPINLPYKIDKQDAINLKNNFKNVEHLFNFFDE